MLQLVAIIAGRKGAQTASEDLTIVEAVAISGWFEDTGTPLQWTQKFKPNGTNADSGKVVGIGWFGLSGPFSFDVIVNYPDGDPGQDWLQKVRIETDAAGTFVEYTQADLTTYSYAGGTGNATWSFDEGGTIHWVGQNGNQNIVELYG